MGNGGTGLTGHTTLLQLRRNHYFNQITQWHCAGKRIRRVLGNVMVAFVEMDDLVWVSHNTVFLVDGLLGISIKARYM